MDSNDLARRSCGRPVIFDLFKTMPGLQRVLLQKISLCSRCQDRQIVCGWTVEVGSLSFGLGSASSTSLCWSFLKTVLQGMSCYLRLLPLCVKHFQGILSIAFFILKDSSLHAGKVQSSGTSTSKWLPTASWHNPGKLQPHTGVFVPCFECGIMWSLAAFLTTFWILLVPNICLWDVLDIRQSSLVEQSTPLCSFSVPFAGHIQADWQRFPRQGRVGELGREKITGLFISQELWKHVFQQSSLNW